MLGMDKTLHEQMIKPLELIGFHLHQPHEARFDHATHGVCLKIGDRPPPKINQSAVCLWFPFKIDPTAYRASATHDVLSCSKPKLLVSHLLVCAGAARPRELLRAHMGAEVIRSVSPASGFLLEGLPSKCCPEKVPLVSPHIHISGNV